MTAPRHTFPFLGQSRVVTVSATSLPASQPRFHRLFAHSITKCAHRFFDRYPNLIALRVSSLNKVFTRYIKNLLHVYQNKILPWFWTILNNNNRIKNNLFTRGPSLRLESFCLKDSTWSNSWLPKEKETENQTNEFVLFDEICVPDDSDTNLKETRRIYLEIVESLFWTY